MSDAAQQLGEEIKKTFKTVNAINVIDPDAPAPTPKRGTAAGRLIEPPPEDIVLVTYPDTLDGFVAAWVVRKVAQKHNIALEMVAEGGGIQCGGSSPGRNHIHIGEDGFPAGTEGKGLLIFFRGSAEIAAPLPFKSWKRTFPFGIESMLKEPSKLCGVFDKGRSLSAIAWDFFYADRKGFDPRPRFLEYLNDHLTANKFADTAAVVACAESYGRQFKTLDSFIEACDDRKRLAYVIAGGQAILRYRELHEAE